MSEKNFSSQVAAANAVSRTRQPDDYPTRFPVPDALTDWRVEFPGYAPVMHDAPRAESPKAKPGDYADPADPNEVNWQGRSSHTGPILRDMYGYPLNPLGRTGIAPGRGKLNAWGPTKAVDAIVTYTTESGETALLVIVRTDNGKTGLPAGKLNVNSQNEVIESTVAAAGRETLEETGAALDFADAREVYSGYADDERNTDNAWMETVALHKHLSQEAASQLVLAAQEADASQPQWRVITPELLLSLNANNGDVVRRAFQL
jgi:ADP-ribose pyrophosphatase